MPVLKLCHAPRLDLPLKLVNRYLSAYGGPPLHLHFDQEEWFYVMEGEVAFQVGEQRVHLRGGESVLAPRRVPHTFSSVAATPSRLLIAFSPAGKMEQYFPRYRIRPGLRRGCGLHAAVRHAARRPISVLEIFRLDREIDEPALRIGGDKLHRNPVAHVQSLPVVPRRTRLPGIDQHSIHMRI